ncbi:MAG: alpha-hydroxy-acid oxidizing protein [Candidatus Kapaibacterium sp.]|nr:MAG: alpha-hydroxy-acid oxidizing protein [Candidatus Kapabacteria bacterium]
MTHTLNLFDIEQNALQVLTSNAREYYLGGAADEITLRANICAFQHIFLRPRILADVAERSLQTSVLEQAWTMPIGIAPTAMQKLAHPEGEHATLKAAQNLGVPMICSTTATVAIEDLLQARKGANAWFQVYVYKDREVTRELVQRARDAGCRAIVLTADTPYLGKRERETRSGFHLPPTMELPNYRGLGTAAKNVRKSKETSGLAEHFAKNIDPALGWTDIEWLAAQTALPLVVKGVLRADDAILAWKHGAKGVIVSNHGGRQLDTAIPSIHALPAIAEAIGEVVDVMLDGGIRRGTDVLKALALGAKAVFLGRPVLYGLAWQGEQGVERVLAILREELDLAMALCGIKSVHEIHRDILSLPHQHWH